jgi:uncharacterized protein YndB with AHSA1/START domain
MSGLRLVREYPHPPWKVWRALTEPTLMALWGMRPEGFSPVAGTRFRLVAKPNPNWRGFVDCEVLEVREPALLRYAWDGDGKGSPTELSYRLEPVAGGTRLTVEHTGFRGVGGFVLAKLIMAPGWKKMVGTSFPAVLAELDDEGRLRSDSPLRPMF